jgi:hypothetical protein
MSVERGTQTWAAFGRDPRSVQSDAVVLNGQLATQAAAGEGYSVQRISQTAPSSMNVSLLPEPCSRYLLPLGLKAEDFR